MPAPFAPVLSALTLELTLETPVERDVTALTLALIPLDAEADREFTPVVSAATPLALVLMPDEADVERELAPVDRDITPL